MPRYFRRRYYPRYRRYRRFYRRRYYKKRYVNTSSRSTVKVRINFEWQGMATTVGATGVTPIIQFCPYKAAGAATYEGALHSDLYRLYCDLYDEVKCNAMKIKFNIIDTIGDATIPSLTVHTGWDRRKPALYAGPPFAEIAGNPAYKSSICLNNNVAKFSRSIVAADIQERSNYHDCKYIAAGGSYQDQAYQAYGNACPFFAPALYCFLENSNTAMTTIHYICQATYWFTFRSPKYGLTQPSKGDDFRGPGVPPDSDDDSDGGDMDGGEAGGHDMDDPRGDMDGPGVRRKHDSPARDQRGRVLDTELEEDPTMFDIDVGGDGGPADVIDRDTMLKISRQYPHPVTFHVNRHTDAREAGKRGGKILGAAGTVAATAGAALIARAVHQAGALDPQ